jgi:hypothetical protein
MQDAIPSILFEKNPLGIGPKQQNCLLNHSNLERKSPYATAPCGHFRGYFLSGTAIHCHANEIPFRRPSSDAARWHAARLALRAVCVASIGGILAKQMGNWTDIQRICPFSSPFWHLLRREEIIPLNEFYSILND